MNMHPNFRLQVETRCQFGNQKKARTVVAAFLHIVFIRKAVVVAFRVFKLQL